MRSLLVVAAAVQSASFPVFWNVNEYADPPVPVTNWGILPRNLTQCGNACSNPGCKNMNWGFPTIADDGTPSLGGVPQAGSFTAFKAGLEAGIPQWIPDPEWDGNAVLDFEAWTTVWELNTGGGNWHGKRYADYSKELVKKQHPDWTDAQVSAAAKEAFEKAATEWFATALNTGRSLRPKAKWGFYGLPVNLASPCNADETKCGYDGPLGALYKSYSDRQKPIWEASSGLFPSIYIAPGLSEVHTAAYINNTVTEAIRCANSVGGRPVLPYMWSRYHNGTTLLSRPDLRMELRLPRAKGAQGVVIWGSEK
eukprot:Hpha_TRINITY_DN16450_c2_g9::TRINITY_DN16450_c2_g9_i1::g.163867::m.163867/K01197/hya; hyaluronoglucosaminidase